MNIRAPLLAASALAALAFLTACGGSAGGTGLPAAPPEPLRITSLCSAPNYVLTQAPEDLCGSLSNEQNRPARNDNDPRGLHGNAPAGVAPLRFTPSEQLCTVVPDSPSLGHRGYRVTC